MKILTIAIALISLNVNAKRLHHEKYYQQIHCNNLQGQAEHKLLDNRRVDCLTDKYAMEHDFIDKWGECIGQALSYGTAMHKIPVCVLIVEDKSQLYKARYVREQKVRTVILFPTANGIKCESKVKELCNNTK